MDLWTLNTVHHDVKSEKSIISFGNHEWKSPPPEPSRISIRSILMDLHAALDRGFLDHFPYLSHLGVDIYSIMHTNIGQM